MSAEGLPVEVAREAMGHGSGHGSDARDMPGRVPELDGLRGLAALTVVFHHALIVLPSIYDRTPHGWVKLVVFSPLHVAFAGDEAVVLFFVLSGYVLSLPFMASTPGGSTRYRTFLIRRFFRLWLPYAVAVTAGFVLRAVVSNHRGESFLSGWYAGIWHGPVTAANYAAHYSMVAPFDDSQSVPVTWSLAYEMRLSIVFPILAWLVLRYPTEYAVGALLAVGAVANIAAERVGYANELNTLYYGSMFALGVGLAKRRRLIARFFRHHRVWPWALLGLLLYTSQWTERGLGTTPTIIEREAVVGGAAIFIVAALHAEPFRVALRSRPVQTLGAISYSLYLTHTLVLLTILHLFAGRAPLAVLLTAAVALAVPAAWPVWRWVEQPSIRLGKRLTLTNRSAHSDDRAAGVAPVRAV